MKLSGKVIKGQGFATLAFGLPTANFEFSQAVNLEAGSYVGYVYVGSQRYNAVMYAGPQGTEKFEAHLFDFEGDLYEQVLKLEVLQLISPHVAWESEDQMKAKVWQDVALAKAYFSTAF